MLNILLSFFLLISCTALASTKIAYYAVDMDTHQVIGKRDENSQMPLASLTKIPSLHYSLSKLGPDFRFTTQLLYKDGTLVLKGGGDPSLTAQQLMSFVFAIPKEKIHRFYVDHSGFPLVEQLANLGMEDQTDQPSLSSLNIEFNRFEVMRSSNDMIPLLADFRLGKAEKGSIGPKYLYNAGVWRPNLTEKRPYRVALPSRMPKSFFAEYLRSYAQRVGITLPSPTYLEKSKQWKGFQTLYTHDSVDLFRVASLAMEYSNNLMAEMPMIAAGKNGGYTERLLKMNQWLNAHTVMKSNAFNLVNASGIGLENTTSAKQLTLLLNSLSEQKYGERSAWSLFSIGGHSGWIRRRFHDQNARHRVFAKTGSIFFAKNIAGYLLTKKGKKIAFSILIFDPERRKELSKNRLTQQGKALRKQAKNWGRAREDDADNLIQQWLRR